MDAVSALFTCLETDDIDLIVAGAYGHSRWLEGLFGGVSEDLIRQESMAVLLSHSDSVTTTGWQSGWPPIVSRKMRGWDL